MPTSITAPPSADTRQGVRFFTWPLAVVAPLALAGLAYPGSGTHPDEGLYLALGLEMFDRGQWLTASLDGVPNFVKPPLLYWAMEAFFHFFGPSLWAGRLF